MSLALVIKQRGSAYAAAQKKYKESVVFVNTQMTSVLSSQLPTVTVTPPDWNTYTTAYTQAQGDALDWVNTVLARLLSVPQEVQTYDGAVEAALQDAITQANALISNPSNSLALANLKADLTTVLGTLNLVTVFISGAVTNIQNFSNKLPDLAQQLQSIANKSTKDAGADEAQIAQLTTNVAAWQKEVNNLIGAIVALGLVDVAAAALATLASVVAWPEGAIIGWLFAGVVIGIATYYITIDGIAIKNLQAKIADAANQMNNLTASVATLHLLSQTFTGLANKTVEVEADVKAVLATWQAFEGDIKTAVGQIQAAITKEGSKNFGAIKTEVTDALAEWKKVNKEAGALVLTLTVKQGVQLTVGMTPKDVKSASDNAPSIDIIDYYNEQAA